MSDLIRSTRKELSLTGQDLGKRLGVTPGAVSQMERAEREGRIQMGTLTRAMRAMGCGIAIGATKESPWSRYSPARTAEAMVDALRKEDTAFALRILTESIKHLEANPHILTESEITEEPTAELGNKWRQLLNATFESYLDDSRLSEWLRPEPLAEPWFVSQFKPLRERAETTTPDYLRKLNIFLDERTLARA